MYRVMTNKSLPDVITSVGSVSWTYRASEFRNSGRAVDNALDDLRKGLGNKGLQVHGCLIAVKAWHYFERSMQRAVCDGILRKLPAQGLCRIDVHVE